MIRGLGSTDLSNAGSVDDRTAGSSSVDGMIWPIRPSISSHYMNACEGNTKVYAREELARISISVIEINRMA